MTDICNWNQYDDEYGSYEADCGMEFELNDGTPEDNHMKFCCGCGKPISIHLLNRRCIPMSKVFEIKFETTVADSKEITVENHYWIAGSL